VLIHRPKVIEPVVLDGLPVTSAAQTLMDIAPRCSSYDLQKALANADFHKLLEAGALRAVMGRGHPGSAKLRRALKTHMPELAETLSYLEDMMLLLCRRFGIPLPVPNKKIGPYTPDGVWPDAMLIVELDGGGNHSSPTQRRIDSERSMYFRSLGYLVLRYTYWQVKRQGAAIAAEIIATLAARSAEPSAALASTQPN
jgi:very-short-patch-repair endonuclease